LNYQDSDIVCKIKNLIKEDGKNLERIKLMKYGPDNHSLLHAAAINIRAKLCGFLIDHIFRGLINFVII
jgi:hypothetical protein